MGSANKTLASRLNDERDTYIHTLRQSVWLTSGGEAGLLEPEQLSEMVFCGQPSASEVKGFSVGNQRGS